jgi:hypothetical protein
VHFARIDREVDALENFAIGYRREQVLDFE